MTERKWTCGTCDAWHPNRAVVNGKEGSCRAKPVQGFGAFGQAKNVLSNQVQLVLQMQGAFPPIGADEPGCREHKQRLAS